MRASLRFTVIASCGLVTGAAVAASSTAVEYFQTAYGHYFVTASPTEIAALDGGTLRGWSRTGQSFEVLALGTPAEVQAHPGVIEAYLGSTDDLSSLRRQAA